MGKYKLAFLTSHPIQYQAPLFRKLAQHPEIELTVYFCSDLGLHGNIDPGFGVAVKWDVPILEGYSHTFLKNFPMASHPLRFWKFFNPSVMWKLSPKQHDAVMIHGYGHATHWLAFLAACFRGIPLFLHGETLLHQNRGTLFRTVKSTILKQLFKKAQGFLYIGTRSHAFYKAHGVPDGKLFFSPYSVNNDYFMAESQRWHGKRAETRKALGLREDDVVILCVSKLYPGKRLMDCIEAVEKLSEKARLVFVGDGTQRHELEAYVQDKKINKVLFLGFKNQSELPRYYAMADLFVLPSASERWGLVINEAMCFGLPIISSSAVACSDDLVQQGENGFVYPVGTISALSGYLGDLVESKKKREEMGQKSLQLISSWNYDRCVDGILRALSSTKNIQKREEIKVANPNMTS